MAAPWGDWGQVFLSLSIPLLFMRSLAGAVLAGKISGGHGPGAREKEGVLNMPFDHNHPQRNF